MNPDPDSPIGHAESRPLEFDDVIVPLVPVLLGDRRPTAIPRLVSPFIVDAFNREPLPGPHAHVGEEIQEPVISAPPVGHGNPPAAIIPIGTPVRVEAPLDDMYPRKPFGRPRVAMLGVGGHCTLHPETVARGGFPRLQVVSADDGEISAVATTRPIGPFPVNARQPNHGQSPEFLPGDVAAPGAANRVRHVVSLRHSV